MCPTSSDCLLYHAKFIPDNTYVFKIFPGGHAPKSPRISMLCLLICCLPKILILWFCPFNIFLKCNPVDKGINAIKIGMHQISWNNFKGESKEHDSSIIGQIQTKYVVIRPRAGSPSQISVIDVKINIL